MAARTTHLVSSHEEIARTLVEERQGDLRDVLVVFPGGRAGRSCLAAMIEAADDLGVPFHPPTTVTPGDLEFRLRPDAPVASATPIDVLCASIQALEAAGLDASIAPRLVRSTRELAAALQSWQDVASAAVACGGESERYETFQALTADVRARLDAVGLLDPDTARADALAIPPDPELDVVLVGVVELPPRTIAALEEVAVTSFVLAESVYAEGFDELGLIQPTWWRNHPPHVPLAAVHLEDKPIDQAEAVVDLLAEGLGEEPLDVATTTVVVADESMVDVLERELVAAGALVHRGQGTPLSTLAPARLLWALATLLEDETVAALREFIAHSAVERLLTETETEPLEAIDVWLRGEFSRSLGEDDWIGDPEEKNLYRTVAAARRTLQKVVPVIDALLEGLRGANRTPSRWMPVIATALKTIHAGAPEDDALHDAALDHLGRVAAEILAVPEALQAELSAAEAIRLLLSTAGNESIRAVQPTFAAELELIGWLEAPFDTAQRVVVAGFNDEAIPGSGGVDPLLPEALREHLGLATAATRTARDQWVLSQVLARTASFTLSRRDGRGEPRAPSRLLLGGSGKDLAERVLALTSTPASRQERGAPSSSFGRPQPEPGPIEFDRIPVTGFREYLRCSYGFWLRYVRRLQGPDATGRELDPRGFGTVVHHVAEAYSKREEANTLTDVDAIAAILDDLLDVELARLVGGHQPVPIRLQREILRGRFRAFAAFQSQSVVDGWRTEHVELGLEVPLAIPGGEPITVRGTVDRVDLHPQLGWRILDIKTSDKGHPPDKTHLVKTTGRWLDLQLPLYRELLKPQLLKKHEGPIETGYVNLPADSAKAGLAPSKAITELHAEAIEAAHDVVAMIRSGAFSLGKTLPGPTDDRALIYRVHSVGDGGEDE